MKKAEDTQLRESARDVWLAARAAESRGDHEAALELYRKALPLGPHVAGRVRFLENKIEGIEDAESVDEEAGLNSAPPLPRKGSGSASYLGADGTTRDSAKSGEGHGQVRLILSILGIGLVLLAVALVIFSRSLQEVVPTALAGVLGLWLGPVIESWWKDLTWDSNFDKGRDVRLLLLLGIGLVIVVVALVIFS